MTTNQPAIVRILNRNGKRFNDDDYRQLAELGQFLAQQWQGVARVKLTATYAVAFDDICVRYGTIPYASLPEHLQDAVRDLNLDGVEMEFIEF